MSATREQYAEQHVNRIMKNYAGPIPEDEARADSKKAALEFWDTYLSTEGTHMNSIDLTPTNEAAARALYAELEANRVLENYPFELTDEDADTWRRDLIASAHETWNDTLAPGGKVRYLTLAEAVQSASWEGTARQAWNHAVNHALNHNLITTRCADTFRSANPYTKGA